MKYKNVIGPQVRRLRWEHQWTQEKLAIELHKLGWEKISRSGVSKIEGGFIGLRDFRHLYFAEVFDVEVGDLFPLIRETEELDEAVTRLLTNRR